jgi:hypothetical protein
MNAARAARRAVRGRRAEASAAHPEIVVPALASLPRAQLRAMVMAGAEVMECYRVLTKGGVNLVSEVLREQGEFIEYEHYPKNDVYDSDTGAQYYYHAHRGGSGEHGHFHTFIRNPVAVLGKPPLSRGEIDPDANGETSHLIAISMDAYGFPIGLFATNRWVTGESWYGAADAIALLDRFRMDHAYPSWPVNRWLGAMLVLFRPQIEALLKHRDAVVETQTKSRDAEAVFEDRGLEITGYIPISVEDTLEEVRANVGKRQRA